MLFENAFRFLNLSFINAFALSVRMFALELDRVIAQINEKKAKRVLIQLPDGLKTKAGEITDNIERKTGASVFIWFGSWFGACDLPQGLKPLGIDLVIAWGHNRYHKTVEQW